VVSSRSEHFRKDGCGWERIVTHALLQMEMFFYGTCSITCLETQCGAASAQRSCKIHALVCFSGDHVIHCPFMHRCRIALMLRAKHMTVITGRTPTCSPAACSLTTPEACSRMAWRRASGATGRAFHPHDSNERFQSCILLLILLSQALLGAMIATEAPKWHWTSMLMTGWPQGVSAPGLPQIRTCAH
jgi:hypothetical protein